MRSAKADKSDPPASKARAGVDLRQHRGSGLVEALCRLQQAQAGRRQPGAATASTSHQLFKQGETGQIAERVKRLPGRPVAHAGTPRRLRDGADLPNAPQDVDALIAGRVAERVGQKQLGCCHCGHCV